MSKIRNENRGTTERITRLQLGPWFSLLVLIVIVFTLGSVSTLVLMVRDTLRIQPKDVLEALEKESSYTRQQVMDRLDQIEHEHMRYVEEYRKTKEK